MKKSRSGKTTTTTTTTTLSTSHISFSLAKAGQDKTKIILESHAWDKKKNKHFFRGDQ
jgi:hypothetical protein